MSVAGFKSIQRMSLEMGQMNVLIGANGSGKSNFLGLFRLLRAIAAGTLRQYVAAAGGSESLLHFGPKITTDIEIDVDFGSIGYACVLGAVNGSGLFFRHEAVRSRASVAASVQSQDLGEGHNESKLNQPNLGLGWVQNSVREQLSQCRVYHFADTSATAAARRLVYMQDNEFLHEDGGNLAAYLYLLKSNYPTQYDLIQKTIRRVAPFFDDFALKGLVNNPQQVQLDWREIGRDNVFAPSALSDGTLRFMCLATLLLQPMLPTTILIDEPELGLHPFALSLLAGLIRSASAKAQIILTTQSVDLLNEFEPEQVIVCEKSAGVSSFERLDAQRYVAWLQDYSVGELWQKNVIGGGPDA